MKRSKAQVKKIVRRAGFLRRLLKENGLILGGFDPGVLAYRKIGKDFMGVERSISLDFSRQDWDWLEPLLLEMRKLRRVDSRHAGHSGDKSE